MADSTAMAHAQGFHGILNAGHADLRETYRDT